MAEASVKLPGGSGHSASAVDLLRAAEDASQLARDLTVAQFATASVAEDKLDDCQLSVIRIGHVLGLTFAHLKRHSAEIVMQRAELAITAAMRKHHADVLVRAANSDRYKRRAEAAEETVRELMAENARLRGVQPAHLVAAE